MRRQGLLISHFSMQIKFIDHTDPFLERVILLGKKYSSTLGLMPRDAYIEQARKKCIVIAYEKNDLIGFCLFRTTISKSRIGITQVCVDEGFRGRGVPKQLLDAIYDKYRLQYNGMIVSCREDYHSACKLWEAYGFVKRKRIRSRSIEENYLLKFWFDFATPNLFSSADSDDALRVVLDLNILIKLRDKEEVNEEIAFLFSDWLIEEVDYYYATETLNEIHRDKDYKRTLLTTQYLSKFFELSSSPKEHVSFLSKLETLHPGKSPNHLSDRKQLAESCACGIPYFITLDEEMLGNRENIHEQLDIRILRPSEFILEIDEIKNKQLYEPARLQGARFTVKKVDSDEVKQVVEHFIDNKSGEKKVEFFQTVVNTIADVKNSCVKVISDPNGVKVALYGYQRRADSLAVEFVRIREKSLENTLFNQLLLEMINAALKHGCVTIAIHEENLTNDYSVILIRNGFFKTADKWIKFAIDGICSYSQLRELNTIVASDKYVGDICDTINEQLNVEIKSGLKLDLERMLWPIKFKDLEIPVFIVPIKPYWASQLFDFLSANVTLFGAVPELTWSMENVYYRSVSPNVEQFPARILWYASDQTGYPRRKGIVASSYLNNVVIGEAKQLYNTFKRYGIYKWPEIFKLAKEDSKTIIKALQFSHTEVFRNVVKLSTVSAIMTEVGQKKNSFMSPVRVTKEVFFKIYAMKDVR
jgi:GNAT superfamily N-acetyltransferase/predicted nucleic acid-binding protein